MAGSVPHGADVRLRFGNGFLVSLLTHVGSVLLIFFIIAHLPPPTPSTTPPERSPNGIIWTQVAGPGGGGGGGGNSTPTPPRIAELPGKQKVTIPVTKPPVLAPEPPKEIPKPPAQLNIPAVTTAASIQEMPGALTGLPAVPSQGIGVGGGAGTGRGTGIGPGSGSGLGPGTGGGTGGGVYRPGNDVSWPRLLYEKKPAYTADAMRAKVQGIVEVEALVLPDGTVGDAKVTRSLDQTFGLDREALIAVRQWKFSPAIRRGQAVSVLVPIEVSFTLR